MLRYDCTVCRDSFVIYSFDLRFGECALSAYCFGAGSDCSAFGVLFFPVNYPPPVHICTASAKESCVIHHADAVLTLLF